MVAKGWNMDTVFLTYLKNNVPFFCRNIPTINGNPQLTHALVSFQTKWHVPAPEAIKPVLPNARLKNKKDVMVA